MQAFAQGLVGAEQKTFCGGLAEFQNFSDFAIIQPLVFVHDDGDALAFGKGLHLFANGLETLISEDILLDVGREVGEIGAVAGFRIGGIEVDVGCGDSSLESRVY